MEDELLGFLVPITGSLDDQSREDASLHLGEEEAAELTLLLDVIKHLDLLRA